MKEEYEESAPLIREIGAESFLTLDSDCAQSMGLTAPEKTALICGMRVIAANRGGLGRLCR